MPAQTSSPESSSSEDDDDRSFPARFGLFPLAFQVSPIPMSCVLSHGSQPENIRPTCPSFWKEVKNSQRVRRSSWRRWDGSSSWNPEDSLVRFGHLFPTHTSPWVLAITFWTGSKVSPVYISIQVEGGLL